MEPIELELVMRNSTKSAMNEITLDVVNLTRAFDQAGNDIQRRIEILGKSMEQLTQELTSLYSQFNSAIRRGVDFTEQLAEVNVLKREIDSLKASLSELEQEQQGKKRSASDTKIDLGDGGNGSGSFAAIADGAGQLTDVLSDGVDVLSLFSSGNERLMQIQKGLQAVMISTNAVKQVSNLLDQQSTSQTGLLAGAKAMLATVVQRLSGSMGFLSKAIRGVSGALGIVSVVVTAVTTIWDLFNSKEDEVNETTDETKKKQEELARKLDQTAKSYGSSRAEIESLRAALDSENISRSKKLDIISKLQDIIPGYNAALDGEGKVLWENKKAIDAYLDSLEKSLKFKAANSDLEALYADLYKVELSKYNRNKNVKEVPVDYDAIVAKNGEGNPQNAIDFVNQAAPQGKLRAQNNADDQQINSINKKINTIKGFIKEEGLTGIIKPNRGNNNDKPENDMKEYEYQAERKLQSMIISLKEEGVEKEKMIAEEKYKIEVHRIEKERKAALAHAADLRKKGVTVDDAEVNSINDKYVKQNTEATNIYQGNLNEIDASPTAAQKEIQELQQKYQTLADKRIEIEAKTQAEITEMENANKGGKEVYSQATIDEAKKQQTEALAEIDDKIQGTTSAMSQAFADMSGKTAKEMRAIAKEAEDMYNAVKNGEYVGEADAPDAKEKNHGLTKAQFDKLKGDPEQMAKLGNQVKAVNSQADKAQNAFQKMGSGMKKVFSAGDDAEVLRQGLADIGEGLAAATVIGQQFGDTLGSIGELSGNEKFAEVGNTLSGAMDVANNAMSGAQAGAALGPIGAAAGAAMGFISSVVGKFAGIKKANKELAEKMRQDQIDSNLSELEMNRIYRERYEWAQKIGESTTGHLKRGGAELKKQTTDNAAEQKELWAKLTGQSYESGSHVTKNFWGKKKEKKEYSSLEGKSWEEIERLANNNKLSTEAMKYYEALKSAREEGEDLAKRQEEWLESAKEFYTGTTVESVANGIVEGFLQGKRSAADFSESFENMMRDSMTNALKDSMTEDVSKWRDEYYALANDEDGLTGKDIAYLRKKYDAIIEKQSAEADELEKVTGIKLNDDNKQQSGGGGGFTTMTQEQGTKLEGLFTSLQDHTISMDNKLTDISGVMYDSFNALTQIAGNTNYCRHLETMASDIAEMKRDGIKMK